MWLVNNAEVHAKFSIGMYLSIINTEMYLCYIKTEDINGDLGPKLWT